MSEKKWPAVACCLVVLVVPPCLLLSPTDGSRPQPGLLYALTPEVGEKKVELGAMREYE